MRVIITIDDVSHILTDETSKGCSECSLRKVCYAENSDLCSFFSRDNSCFELLIPETKSKEDD